MCIPVPATRYLLIQMRETGESRFNSVETLLEIDAVYASYDSVNY